MAAKVTEQVRAVINEQLQLARSIVEPASRHNMLDRWLIALDLIDQAENIIGEIADGNRTES